MHRARIVSFATTAMLLIGASAPGQGSATIPSTLESSVVVPGPGSGDRTTSELLSMYCPDGVRNPRTVQVVFNVPPTVPTPVTALAFRRGDRPGATPWATPAFSVTLEAWMAHAVRPPWKLERRYALNRAADFAQIVAPRTLSYPVESWRADGHYPFTYRIPLDHPFTFQRGGLGLFEIRVTSSTLCWNQLPAGAADLDYAIARGVTGGGVIPDMVGVGCTRIGYVPSHPSLLGVAPSIGNHAQEVRFTIQAGGSTSRSRTSFFAGKSGTNWSGLPLPYPLDSLGAPGCTLYASLDWELPKLSEVPHYATAAISAPFDPALIGQHIWVQGVRLDPSFNPLGVITTNALRMTIQPHYHGEIGECSWSTTSSTAIGNAEWVAIQGPVTMLIGK